MKPKMFMTVTDAARYAKLSIRHFRRLYDGGYCMIARKGFVLTKNLDTWIGKRKAS